MRPASSGPTQKQCEALWLSVAATISSALAIAERLQATPYRLRCIWGLWLICNTVGNYAGSRDLALQFGDIVAEAAASPINRSTAPSSMVSAIVEVPCALI